MKDGGAALAYKAEHAVDMETGAIVAVTAHRGATGDTASVQEPLPAAGEAVYGNRRPVAGKRGKALLRKRGEMLERPFAHL